MADSLRRLSFRLLASGAFTLVLATIFLIGFELGGGGGSDSNAGITSPDSLRVHLLKERDTLRALLAESERQRVILQRAAQIDQEATRVLKEGLRRAQDARLELDRELTYLKRLVQSGGKGAIQVYDLRLRQGDESRQFFYTFTVTQLVQGFGRSTGSVRLSIEGARGDEAISLDLADLPAAKPRNLAMEFEHFQNFHGSLELPSGFEPRSIVLTIEPKSDRLISTSVMFPWDLSHP